MRHTGAATKENIVDAAIFLFNTKGFAGTSIREIAEKANANIAHISYYFKGKNGLLEYLVSKFYEDYLRVIEQCLEQCLESPKECLKKVIKDILYYQFNNQMLARFVHREVTLDSTLIRQVMTTYLAKEKYYFHKLLEQGIKAKELKKVDIAHFLAYLKSILNMPFLQPQYLYEVLHINPYEEYFVKQYHQQIISWLEQILFAKKEEAIRLGARHLLK